MTFLTSVFIGVAPNGAHIICLRPHRENFLPRCGRRFYILLYDGAAFMFTVSFCLPPLPLLPAERNEQSARGVHIPAVQTFQLLRVHAERARHGGETVTRAGAVFGKPALRQLYYLPFIHLPDGTGKLAGDIFRRLTALYAVKHRFFALQIRHTAITYAYAPPHITRRKTVCRRQINIPRAKQHADRIYDI